MTFGRLWTIWTPIMETLLLEQRKQHPRQTRPDRTIKGCHSRRVRQSCVASSRVNSLRNKRESNLKKSGNSIVTRGLPHRNQGWLRGLSSLLSGCKTTLNSVNPDSHRRPNDFFSKKSFRLGLLMKGYLRLRLSIHPCKTGGSRFSLLKPRLWHLLKNNTHLSKRSNIISKISIRGR